MAPWFCPWRSWRADERAADLAAALEAVAYDPAVPPVPDELTAALRRRRFGRLVAARGRITRVHFRWLPKKPSVLGIRLFGDRRLRAALADHCTLYYNQPWFHSNYLTLAYVESSRGCRLKTIHAALRGLDSLAELKRCDAIVCHAWNVRLDARLLARYGWQPLGAPQQRLFIKRFYGQYPRAMRAPK